MKKLFFAFLPTLLLSTATLAPAAKAQVNNEMPMAEITMMVSLTPFNLAYLAFQGYFEQQGIKSQGNLMQDFRSGKLSGEDVVKAAVKTNRLPTSYLNNEAYIKGVTAQLYTLSLFN
ncbi:hypothetical protein Syn7502_03212 [Synechococcus sp. PCC 7502]|uniref:hypothetical protein n=1 Tax=Synechococcus sp. PCC 7502 TaxID=1173263 RepID=UPI00029FA6E8|nr:hypothetical protein [Synechococcus sp. PCC 7502]AFY75089.1 hypothetical protein Syn7502_03212 [Synechococcus sp. PCC 7502]